MVEFLDACVVAVSVKQVPAVSDKHVPAPVDGHANGVVELSVP